MSLAYVYRWLFLLLATLLASPVLAQGPPPINYAIPGSARAINSVAVSVRGNYLVSGSADGTAKQFTYPDGVLMHTWSVAPYAINSVAISYDGKVIAFAASNNALELRNAADGSLLKFITTPSMINSLAFSRDATELAAGATDGNIYIYSVPIGNRTKTLRGHTRAVNSVAFAQYNTGAQLKYTLASGSSDGTVRLWNLTNNTRTTLLVGVAVNAVDIWALNPPNDLVYAACNDNKVLIWAIETGKLQQTLSFNAIALSLGVEGSGGNLAVGVADNTVHLEQTASNSTQYTTDTRVGVNAQPYTVLCTYGTSDVVVGLSNNALQRYTQALDLANDFFLLNAPIAGVLPSPDGTQMTIALNGIGLDQLELSNGVLLTNISGSHPLAYSPDGKQLFCQGPTGYETEEVATGQTLRTWPCQPIAAAFLPDGKTLATWSSTTTGQLQLWNLADGRLLQTYNSPEATTQVAFSADGTLLALATSQSEAIMYVYQVPSNFRNWVCNFNVPYTITGLAWSHDGTLLAVQTNEPGNPVHTWQYAKSGADGFRVFAPSPGNTYGAFAVSPYADVLAAYRATDNSLDVWHIHDNTVTFFDEEMGAGVNALAFSPDASMLLLGRADGTLLAAYNPYPISLASFTVSPSLIPGGTSVTGTVTLSPQ